VPFNSSAQADIANPSQCDSVLVDGTLKHLSPKKELRTELRRIPANTFIDHRLFLSATSMAEISAGLYFLGYFWRLASLSI